MFDHIWTIFTVCKYLMHLCVNLIAYFEKHTRPARFRHLDLVQETFDRAEEIVEAQHATRRGNFRGGKTKPGLVCDANKMSK